MLHSKNYADSEIVTQSTCLSHRCHLVQSLPSFPQILVLPAASAHKVIHCK